jgi:hypothetical protein
MGNSKAWYALLTVTYCSLALTYVWPYLMQVKGAFQNGVPIRQVPRPATNKLIAGALALIGGVMWTWLYFKQ